MPVNDGNYINHIGLVLDESASMMHLMNDVVAVADNTVKYLAQRSTELDQETRGTVYTFHSDAMANNRFARYDYTTQIECVYYDKDVLRLPSLKGKYRPEGGTPLIDATLQAIRDLQKTATLYGDHAFLLYVLTDGMENTSKANSFDLLNVIEKLPDNWTVACMVPNQHGVFEAKKFGFLANNISVWDTSAKGIAEVGEVIRKSTDNFMVGRTQGIRGTKNIFSLDVANLRLENLERLPDEQFIILQHPRFGTQAIEIRPFVEHHTGIGTYQLGNAYYELIKTETIQASKQLCVMDNKNRVYHGKYARQMLGLGHDSVMVKPADHSDVSIFVQSTSTNRKVIPGQRIIVIK